MPRYLIAENGESDFHIVNHEYSDETVRFACSELQKYLLKATNAAIPYFSDRCPTRGKEIRVGEYVRNATNVETNLKPDSFRIAACGDHITITGSNSRGVLYGVYRFLEIFCGFRCFTKDVETIDSFEKLEIELDEIIEEPAFDFREAYFRDAFNGDFCAKNRLNANMGDISKAHGGRMKWYNFHHSFSNLVPEKVYFDEHPEYFSEINGKRERHSQLCLTNPDVYEIAEKTLRQWIKNNPECTVFSIGQNDNQRRCTCKNCLELESKEESPAGPMIHFVNKLADAIKDDHPNILLHTFAYQYTLPEPKYVVARDNVIVRLCSIACRFNKPFEVLAMESDSNYESIFTNAISSWKDHAKHIYVWDYAVNFRNYLMPFFHFHTMAENIRFFAKNGVRGVLEQGNFAHGGGACGEDLKSYLIGKLLWNPETDIDDEMNRYFRGVYGEKASQYIKEYYSLFEKACSGDNPITIFQNPNADYITDELIEKCETLIKNAIEASENEIIRKRVEREYLSMRYLKLVRSDLQTEGREEMIRTFIDDVKRFGITEIMERTSIAASREIMLKSRYTHNRDARYSLYYIMQ